MASNVGLVSVIKRKLAVLLRILTPRTDLLMNPYFVPQLALLLMEGVGRRAISHAAVTPDSALLPAYQPIRTGDERSHRFAQAEAGDRQAVHISRHFGQPGPLR